MSTVKITGHPGRQREPLTVRLHGLIRDYPRGLGIFKEFIQNADDAGASKVTFVVDWRTHPSRELPASSMQSIMGPSLIIYNDAEFTQEDFEAIQEIGRGNKLQRLTKTGRFGLGFNVAYNVSDYPSFIAGSLGRIQFFDPHENTIPPDDNNDRGGCFYYLDDLWKYCPDTLGPFKLLGCRPDQRFSGTAFRLPLRTEEQALKSDICKEAFTEKDFSQIFEQLLEMGPELLLFLKHLQHLEVYEVHDSEDTLNALLSITTINSDEVREARQEINNFVVDDPAAMLAKVHSSSTLPAKTYKHLIKVQRKDKTLEQTWLISNGLYKDIGHEVVSIMGEMIKQEEKAIPWVGVAYRLTRQFDGEDNQPFQGKVYCFLPLPEITYLPVHVNGFFDLASSRQTITADGDLSGESNLNRAKWNKVLVNHCLAKAYAELIVALVNEIGQSDIGHFYNAWPHFKQQLPGSLKDLPVNVYRQLHGKAVLYTATDKSWVSINNIKLLPISWSELQEPLVLENIAIPDPKIPENISNGFAQSGINIDNLTITPKFVRDLLRKTSDTNCPIEQAPHNCLRQRKWIISLLRFCLSDNIGNGECLRGVPLLILYDKRLHTFGNFQGVKYVMINSTEDERSIFNNYPQWFVDPDFTEKSQLSPLPQINVLATTLSLVVVNLPTVISKVEQGTFLEWEPEGTEAPNSPWLELVFRYFSRKKVEGFCIDQNNPEIFKSLPLAPDQNHRLWRTGDAYTPLLKPKNQDSSLLDSLVYLNLPVISGSDSVIDAIHAFVSAYPNKFILEITPCTLVDTLDAHKDEWTDNSREFREEIHVTILDFLSTPDALKNLQSEERFDKAMKLPIVPLETGEIVTAQEADIYIPVVEPPPIAGNVRLVNTGPNSRWRELFKALQIPELDVPNLVYRILDGYSDLSQVKKVTALRWIKNNLDKAESQLIENGNMHNGAASLRIAVSTADLIICTDGVMRPLNQVYSPDVELTKKVLRERAFIPDMEVYDKGAKYWLEFFKKLGMAENPRARDLLVHIDNLIAKSKIEGADTVSEQLVQVYEHIKDNWEDLAHEVVFDPITKTNITLQSALNSRTWLPALRDIELAKGFPGFQRPENRLYKANELHVRRNAHLIASHKPILASSQEPTGPVRDAIGLIANPALDSVMRHYDNLLSLWINPDHSGMRMQDFETSLRAIYFYFGNPPKEIQSPDFVDRLRMHFHESYCVWDFQDETKDGKKFWKPRHTFKDRVTLLKPYRTQIFNTVREENGYSALGRRDRPELDDYLELLEDLYAICEDQQLPEQIVTTLLFIYSQIVLEQDFEEGINGDLPVLTADGLLVQAINTYVSDAPWYRDLIDEEQVKIVDPKVPLDLIKALRIEGLSAGVNDEVVGIPILSSDPNILDMCLRWEKLLQASEFQRGLERLIKHNGGVIRQGDLEWLRSVHILAADQIKTVLRLKRDQQIIGKGEKNSHFDPTQNIIYLLADDERLMENSLAQEINIQLSENHQEDLVPLTTILCITPDKIDATLTKMRIRQYEVVIIEIPYDEGPGEPSLFAAEGGQAGTEDEEPSIPEDGKPVEASQFIGGTSFSPVKDFPRDDSPGKKPGALVPIKGRGIQKSGQRTKGVGSQYSGGPASPLRGEATGSPAAERESEQFESFNETEEETTQKKGDHIQTIDVEKPVAWKPIHKVRTRKPSGRKHLTISRVFSREYREQKRDVDQFDDELPHNMAVGDAAVEKVMKFERDEERFTAEKKPHNNPGFDVRSVSPDGMIIKYIEVKGIDGPWTVDGVPVSPIQFKFGQQHEESPGEEFWLYVVEYALDDDQYVIHRIKNPISKVDQFRFDSGWKELAESHQQTLQLAKGMIVNIDDEKGGKEGKIVDVSGEGTLKIIQVMFSDGTDERIPYRPSKMTIRKDE
jgi:sacsin